MKLKLKSKKERKLQKGITLIALVITIIVLLILAGVSIATLTGDNGILTKAQTAKTETEQASGEEQLKLAAMNAAMHTQSYNYTTEDNKTVTIPAGFAPTQIEGENAVDEGLVIVDSQENSYVWVEVPKTTTVYETTGLDKTVFEDNVYQSIEADLNAYASAYKDTRYKDEWYSKEQNGLTSEKYTELKNKMLKGIYTNGGFWAGQYEMGTATLRTDKDAELTSPVCKEGEYPYNFVTCSQAQQLASSMNSGNYTSSLMFGIQWDLMLKFLEEKKAKTQTELKEDSSSWGNYKSAEFTVTKGKYSEYTGVSFKDVIKKYTKPDEISILLTTGTSKRNSALNIFDIAGNVTEWTLEGDTVERGNVSCWRGGSCFDKGNSYSAFHQDYSYNSQGNQGSQSLSGFRSALY